MTALARGLRHPHPMPLYRDRRHAGRVLAAALAGYRDRHDLIVLALPRGGVPVAHEVARGLRAPLDVLVVRKLGVPGHEELAMGAIASGGIEVLDPGVIEALHVDPHRIAEVVAAETEELARRELAYRGQRPPLDVSGKLVILVDDGLATGSTMRAAAAALAPRAPAAVVVAVPVAAPASCAVLASIVDHVVCPSTPEHFASVSQWYEDFSPTEDDEVRQLLATPPEQGRPAVAASAEEVLVRAIADTCHPLTGSAHELDPLLAVVGDARVVMIGESTHGTHEYYRLRAQLTRRLIEELGFAAVAVEADWPDAHRVNRWVLGQGDDDAAEEALGDFRRFPAWMWRNADVLDFAGWLRAHNDAGPVRDRVGFFGLDLYSLHASIESVLAYLDRVDPDAALQARMRYGCFDRFAGSPERYGQASALGLSPDCERQAVAQLIDLGRRRAELTAGSSEDDHFEALQNARVVKNAEEYYRAMFGDAVASWNLRDTHMTDTLDGLLAHLERRGGRERARVVVWAHNSHVGDASATEMGAAGELTLGQLARHRYPGAVRLIGMGTWAGTVTAAPDWGDAPRRMQVRPGLPGSYDDLFHRVGQRGFILPLGDLGEAAGALRERRLERAIGVVYRPESERQSHYHWARLAAQFDAFVHLDETRALEPLERGVELRQGEAPETFPTGM